MIGFSRYDDVRALPAIPAVRTNLADLRKALVGAATGTMKHCVRVSGSAVTTTEIGSTLGSAAQAATDVLLVYYAGHGLVDDSGQLYLALPATDPARLRWTALSFELLRSEILDSPAKTRILVLDCCFSGRAIETMSEPRNVIAGKVDIAGTYIMTSTTATSVSHAPAGQRHTAFTGAMLEALGTSGPVSLDELFRHVDRRLSSHGLPRPQRRAVNAAGDLALCRSSPSDARAELAGRSEPESPAVATVKPSTRRSAAVDVARHEHAARDGAATIGSRTHDGHKSYKIPKTYRIARPQRKAVRTPWQRVGIFVILVLVLILAAIGLRWGDIPAEWDPVGRAIRSDPDSIETGVQGFILLPSVSAAMMASIAYFFVGRDVLLSRAGATVSALGGVVGLLVGPGAVLFALSGGVVVLGQWMSPLIALWTSALVNFVFMLLVFGWDHESGHHFTFRR
nr:caspase family protein [Saccharopolyspora gloriosae]